MRFIGSFYQFTQRILQALKQCKAQKSDIEKLKRLLDRTAKRNIILAKGLLTALSIGGVKESDIKRLSILLERANERICANKEPFTVAEKKELREIFKSAYLSSKAADWFTSQMDELLAAEIDEFIKGKKSVGVPAKKTFSFEQKTNEKEKTLTKT